MIELTGWKVVFTDEAGACHWYSVSSALEGLNRGMISPDKFFWNGTVVSQWQFIALLELYL